MKNKNRIIYDKWVKIKYPRANLHIYGQITCYKKTERLKRNKTAFSRKGLGRIGKPNKEIKSGFIFHILYRIQLKVDLKP